jgi:hypothetical protein
MRNSLLEVIRRMPVTRFVFVGEGEMVENHRLKNVESVGSSESVERYIDAPPVCFFP